VAQVVECLPSKLSKYKASSSSPNTTKTKQKTIKHHSVYCLLLKGLRKCMLSDYYHARDVIYKC
jgi:hypothetical protein